MDSLYLVFKYQFSVYFSSLRFWRELLIILNQIFLSTTQRNFFNFSLFTVESFSLGANMYFLYLPDFCQMSFRTFANLLQILSNFNKERLNEEAMMQKDI